jgi:hypothetical protein
MVCYPDGVPPLAVGGRCIILFLTLDPGKSIVGISESWLAAELLVAPKPPPIAAGS